MDSNPFNVDLISRYLRSKLERHLAEGTCDRCGVFDEGVRWFAPLFRVHELQKKRPDPGNLCGKCAADHLSAHTAAVFSCLPICNPLVVEQ